MKLPGIWSEWTHDEALAEIQYPEWLLIDDSGFNYWNINNGQLLKIGYNQFGKYVHGKAYKFSPDNSLNGYI